MQYCSLTINNKIYEVRRALDSDVKSLTNLLHQAYKELADKGWNYTASYQDEDFTRHQIKERISLLIFDNNELIATISMHDENYFTHRKTMYISKFAVNPNLKKQGIGLRLLEYVEVQAKNLNYEGMQLDTAKPATHLVQWYKRYGFEIIGDIQYEGKTYESWIFEKSLLKT